MATRIKNLDRLNRKLIRLPQRTIDLIRPEMARAADQIVEMAKRFVPVDSGALRDSIGWTWGTDIPEGATALGSVGGRGRNRDPQMTITVYAGNKEVYWARWQEFGTVRHRAHPFFFPAYRAQRKSVKSRIRRAITKGAKAEAAG